MAGLKIEWWYIFCTIAVFLCSVGTFVAILRLRGWDKFIPFLHANSSLGSLSKKIWSFDKAILAKFITDENGIISNVNISAEKLFGYKEADLIGKNFNTLLPVSQSYKFIEMLVRDKGQAVEIKTSYLTLTKKGGAEFPAELIVQKEALEREYFYLLAVIDRTKEEQKVRKFEQIIEINKIKLDILSKGEEIGQNGSWLWDIDKGTLLTSKGYKLIMGLDDRYNEFEADYLRGKVYPKDTHIVSEALEKAFRGESYDITYRIVRVKDVKLITIRSLAEPIMSENKKKVLFIYGSMRLIEEKDIITE